MTTYQQTSTNEYGPKSAQQATRDTIAWVGARRENPGIISGVSGYGYPTLDKMTGGVQPGELAGLGARPGVGKSAWLNGPIQEISSTFQETDADRMIRGVILEMSVREFTLRQICAIAMVPQGKVREGRITDAEYQRILEAGRLLYKLPVEYVDFQTPLPEIERFLRSTKPRRTGWWFVDHLGIIPGVTGGDSNTAARVAGFINELTKFAKEIAPGMVVIPLNRNVEGRQDQHPILSDFKDSSQIESNLQLALGLWRDMKAATRPENRNRAQTGDLDIMKQRNGPTGRIAMLFDAPRTLWYEDEERNREVTVEEYDTAPKPAPAPSPLDDTEAF